MSVRVHDSVVVSVMGCQMRSWGFKSPPGPDIWFWSFAPPAPLTNSSIMSTLTVGCRWEDETAKEGISHPRSYVEAKKMKSLHAHGCLNASLCGRSSSFILL